MFITSKSSHPIAHIDEELKETTDATSMINTAEGGYLTDASTPNEFSRNNDLI